MDETMNDRDITELLYSEDPQGPVQLDKSREAFVSPALYIKGCEAYHNRLSSEKERRKTS